MRTLAHITVFLLLCCAPALAAQRTFYIAADEVAWNYAVLSLPPTNSPPAITTKIADAYRQVPQLDTFKPMAPLSLTWLPHKSDGSLMMAPGAYTWTVQSYCLKLSAHGPGTDAGYLPAPLRGPQTPNLQKLLERTERSAVSQEDIQALVWSMTSRADFIKALGGIEQLFLQGNTQSQQASTQHGASSVPPGLLQVMARLASHTARANNHGIPRTRWTFLPRGYFIRLASTSYKRVRVEVYVPQGWTLRRDSAHRVASVRERAGSEVDVAYRGKTATVHVLDRRALLDSSVALTASADIAYAGAARDDSTALRQLETAIRAASNGSPAWSNLRDRAADDVARTRAELVCKQLPCGVGAWNFPHVPKVTTTNNPSGGTTLTLSGIAAEPPDESLQPLALSGRGADSGIAPSANATPGAKSPDPNADCPEVAATIKLQKFAQSLYGNGKYVEQADAKHENANQYNRMIIGMVQTWYDAGGGSVSGSGGGSSTGSGPASNADTADALAGTDPSTCRISESMAAFRSPAIIRNAAIAHEEVHAATCESRAPAQRSALDTPKNRAADEVKAYNVSITKLEKWYAENCP